MDGGWRDGWWLDMYHRTVRQTGRDTEEQPLPHWCAHTTHTHTHTHHTHTQHAQHVTHTHTHTHTHTRAAGSLVKASRAVPPLVFGDQADPGPGSQSLPSSPWVPPARRREPHGV